MLRALYADFARLFRNKIYVLILILLPVTIGVMELVLDFIMSFLLEGIVLENADLSLTMFASSAALFLAVLASFYTATDFVEGTIRNKLSVGIKRSHIFLSACIVAVAQALFMHLLSTGVVLLVGYTAYDGFSLDAAGIFNLMWVYGLAEVALAVFFTSLVFVFGNTKIVYGICPGIAVFFRVLMIVVMDKLYPSYGPCLLTGARLKIYTFLDQYVPFFHLQSFLRWDNLSYILGGVGTILISVIIGILVINKREIN